MAYRNNGHATAYLEMKKQADMAYAMWQQTGTCLDWDYFMSCEDAVADYAERYEDQIWEIGDTDGGVIL